MTIQPIQPIVNDMLIVQTVSSRERERVNVEEIVGRSITREQTLDGLFLLTEEKKV